MPHWIRLSRLTDLGIRKVKEERDATFDAVTECIEGEGGTLVSAWVTQGRFNLVSVIDAPSEETMNVIDGRINSLGLYTSISLPGIPIDEFLKAFAGDNFGLFLETWLKSERSSKR